MSTALSFVNDAVNVHACFTDSVFVYVGRWADRSKGGWVKICNQRPLLLRGVLSEVRLSLSTDFFAWSRTEVQPSSLQEMLSTSRLLSKLGPRLKPEIR